MKKYFRWLDIFQRAADSRIYHELISSDSYTGLSIRTVVTHYNQHVQIEQ